MASQQELFDILEAVLRQVCEKRGGSDWVIIPLLISGWGAR